MFVEEKKRQEVSAQKALDGSTMLVEINCPKTLVPEETKDLISESKNYAEQVRELALGIATRMDTRLPTKREEDPFKKHLLSRKVPEFITALKTLPDKITSRRTSTGKRLKKLIHALQELSNKITLSALGSKQSIQDALNRLENIAGVRKAFLVGGIPRDSLLGRPVVRAKRGSSKIFTELDVDLVCDLPFVQEVAIERLRGVFPESHYAISAVREVPGLYTIMDHATGKTLYQIMSSQYFNLDKSSERYQSDPLFFEALSRDLVLNAIFVDKEGLVYVPLFATLIALVYGLIHLINKKALYQVEGKEFDENKHSPEFYSYSELYGTKRLLRGVTAGISIDCTSAKNVIVCFSDSFIKSIPEGRALLVPERKGSDYTPEQKAEIRGINLFLSSKVFKELRPEAIFKLYAQFNLIQTLFPRLWETVPHEKINEVLKAEVIIENIYARFLILQYGAELKLLCQSHAEHNDLFRRELENFIHTKVKEQPLYQVCFEDYPRKMAKLAERTARGSLPRTLHILSITDIVLQKIQLHPDIIVPPVSRVVDTRAPIFFGTSLQFSVNSTPSRSDLSSSRSAPPATVLANSEGWQPVFFGRETFTAHAEYTRRIRTAETLGAIAEGPELRKS